MGRPVRRYEGQEIYFVTARTFQGRLFLRGHTRTNDVIGGVLAMAIKKYQVELYGFVVASNHLHLLVRARDGALSAFMQFLLGNIARKVGRLVDWKGALWERRFSAEAVLDDDAVLGRLKYILAHGVKEGLVRRVREWPGLSCVVQLLHGTALTFRWFHWNRRWLKGKLRAGGQDPFSDEWAENVSLRLTVPDVLARLSPAMRQETIRGFISHVEREGRALHKTVLGVARVKAQHPQKRPKTLERAPRPLCHSAHQAIRKAYMVAYRAFFAAYKAASARFRSGDLNVEFPPFAFRPSGFSTTVQIL